MDPPARAKPMFCTLADVAALRLCFFCGYVFVPAIPLDNGMKRLRGHRQAKSKLLGCEVLPLQPLDETSAPVSLPGTTVD